MTVDRETVSAGYRFQLRQDAAPTVTYSCVAAPTLPRSDSLSCLDPCFTAHPPHGQTGVPGVPEGTAASTYPPTLGYLGSIRVLVNAADATAVQRLDYDEFGRVTLNTNPV